MNKVSDKIINKLATPIAKQLYDRGYRKLDSVLEVVKKCIDNSSFINDDDKYACYCEIEKCVNEVDYD